MDVIQMIKYAKRAVGLALAALALLACAGCAGGDGGGPDLDPAEMARAMMDADTTLPQMVERSSGDADGEDSFTYLSSLDYGKVDSYFYACADAGTAEEIAVVKLKDKGDAAALMESLHDHIEARQGTFAEYDPEQLPLTEDAVVTRDGRYVTLIVSKKSGLVQKEFQKFFEQAP